MPKRLNRLNTVRNTSVVEKTEIIENVKTGNAKFTFPNGDVYKGEFIIKNGKSVFKQGYGIYKTENFDIYSAHWDQDNIATDLHIQYNNGMQYSGEINIEGEMTGFGKYVFPDQSSIEGNWKKNKPFTNFKFVEPSGFQWKAVHSNTEKDILFEPGNHFWKELYADLNEKENNIFLNDEVIVHSKLSLKEKKRTVSKKFE